MDKFMRKLNNSPSARKKQQLSTKTFGVPLDDLINRNDSEVPNIVFKICDYLMNRGMGMEGIFRVNGNSKIIEHMRIAFDNNPDVDLTNCNDVYAIAGLLKLFLRELPGGLISEQLTHQFTQALNTLKDDFSALLSEMTRLLSLLPSENYNLLKFLCHFLNQVSENEFENKMSPTSLGIVFGPNVFRCGRDFEGLRNQGTTNRVMALFVEHFSSLFKMAAPSHAQIIQVKEYSRSTAQNRLQHRTNQPKSNSSSLKSEDNSIESPRPKPRLSLQIPTGHDPRFSSRVSDDDYRANSPYSMETENDWSLASPRVSMDISTGLQHVIRACVEDHLFGDISSLLEPGNNRYLRPPSENSMSIEVDVPSVGVGVGGQSHEEEDHSVSNTSDSLAPAPSPRLSKMINGGKSSDRKSATLKASHKVSSDSAHSASLHHDHSSIVIDDYDWPQNSRSVKNNQRGSKSEIETDNSEELNKKSRVKANVRRPRLAFQEKSDDHNETISHAHSVPALNVATVHTTCDAPMSTSPLGDNPNLKTCNSHEDVSELLRNTTKRIQTLKRNIRQFEENFELEYGAKPLQSHKNSNEEVKQWMTQLAEARKLMKQLKSSVNTYSSVSLSTASKPGNNTVTTVSGGHHLTIASQRPLSAISDTSAGDKNTPAESSINPRHGSADLFHPPSSSDAFNKKEARGSAGDKQPSSESVKETYESLLFRLADKRRQAGRPEELDKMSKKEVEAEKLAIQKCLLHFESLHGRPKETADKLLMKPLYDRYRQVKRHLQGDSGTGGEETDGCVGSGTIQRNSKNFMGNCAPVINIPTGESLVQGGTLDFGKATTDFNVTQDWHLLKGERLTNGILPNDKDTLKQRSSSMRAISNVNEHSAEGRSRSFVADSKSGVNDQQSSKNLTDMSYADLLEEQKSVKEEKRILQKVLKDFEHEFEGDVGRKVSREDRVPMRAEYNRYKQVKSRLKLLETLISKQSDNS